MPYVEYTNNTEDDVNAVSQREKFNDKSLLERSLTASLPMFPRQAATVQVQHGSQQKRAVAKKSTASQKQGVVEIAHSSSTPPVHHVINIPPVTETKASHSIVVMTS